MRIDQITNCCIFDFSNDYVGYRVERKSSQLSLFLRKNQKNVFCIPLNRDLNIIYNVAIKYNVYYKWLR